MLSPGSPDAILAESFRIIEAEIGAHGFSAEEWPIVRRIVHATGDLEIARAVRFNRAPVAAALAALRAGRPIVTDVGMVAAGIRRDDLGRLGAGLHCFITDPDVMAAAHATGATRAAGAIERAVATIGSAIYVIGSAPTALLALCDAVQNGRVAPVTVIAMPVGFVAVAESKERALALPCPVIAITGRRGGSPAAAAAVNALIERALREDQACASRWS